MGNMLYQASDNKSIIRGDKTAKYTNSATTNSLRNSSDLTSNLVNYKKGGGCGCSKG
jgi:hypothetical protein